jgi:hypothetical protein
MLLELYRKLQPAFRAELGRGFGLYVPGPGLSNVLVILTYENRSAVPQFDLLAASRKLCVGEL